MVASYNSGGGRLDATRAQIQGVLDYLYVDNGTADDAVLGVTYSGNVPDRAGLGADGEIGDAASLRHRNGRRNRHHTL